MTLRKALESLAGLIRTGNDAKVQIHRYLTGLGLHVPISVKTTAWSEKPKLSPSIGPFICSAMLWKLTSIKWDLPDIVPGTGLQTNTTMVINHLTMVMLWRTKTEFSESKQPRQRLLRVTTDKA
jgi:hypothetical protein